MKNKFFKIFDNIKNKAVSSKETIKDTRKFLLFIMCFFILVYVLFSIIPYLISVMVGHRVEITDNEISSNVSTSGELYTYKNHILLFNSNGMQFYDFDGDYKHSLYFDAYSPYLNISDKVLAVADTNGKNAAVIKNNKIKYTLKSDDTIQLISANKKGYSAIITNEKGYKSLVKVYDSKGENIYQWHIGEYYAVDTYVTENSKYLVVLGVGIDDSNINSYITFINLKEDKIHSEYKIESELAYKLSVKNNGTYVITDSNMYFISSSGKLKYKYNFSGNELLGFDIKDSNNLAIALNDNNSKSIVILLNKRLKTKGQCVVPIQVTMLDSSKEQIAVAGQNEIYITEKNRIYAKGVFAKQTERMRFSENKNHVVTSGGNNVCIYDIKLGR